MIRVLSLNLQHGLPGAGAGDGSASTGSLAGADISDPATARAVMRATAEQIAEHLVRVVGPQQLVGTGIELVSCRVDETRKCSATYVQPPSAPTR